MLGSEFRGLAEAVTRSYGDDPWFFLRELAQNSRDAGARAIWVQARAADGSETLVFTDDGEGMTLEHARRFLFRLYASDKGGDQAAAGRYGVGFWTVLRFQPTSLRIESRRGEGSWGLVLDADLNARPVPCSLVQSGTAVTLSRPATASTAGSFAADVEKGLRTYCRFLRRHDRQASFLQLWYAGKNLVEPIRLPGPLSLSFRDGSLEGAVGLGETPHVRLFARGLPVWEGALLSQMSHLQADAELNADVGAGLAPVFLLNGNHLDVTFTRNLAVENRELERVRRKAKKALHRLLAASLEAAFPEGRLQRWVDRLWTLGARWRRHLAYGLLPMALLLLFLLGRFALRLTFPSPVAAPGASWFSLRQAPKSYHGAKVGPAAAAAPPFAYRPARPSWFRLFVADSYDPAAGFVRDAGAVRLGILPPPRCRDKEGMTMRLPAEAGATFLPLAPGHSLIPGSLRLDGRPLASYSATDLGEAVADLPRGGILEYHSCAEISRDTLPAEELSRYLRLPAATHLPADLEAAAAAASTLPVRDRLQRAMAITVSRIAYDASVPTAGRYRELAAWGDWPGMVLAIGRGDCDVLNGFLVLLLRKMNVPARLVVGIVGSGGEARPLLHAWCECFDLGWKISDATALAAAPPTAAFGPASPLPPPARPGFRTHKTIPWLIIGPALLLLALALCWLKKKGAPRKDMRVSAADAAEPLLRIVQHALLQPDAWGDDNPLWHHRLLPVLGGGFVSLAHALRLQARNKLFVSIDRSPLALSLAAAGVIILDLGMPSFTPLRALFPGAIDADYLARMRLQPPPPGSLLAALNDLCRSLWKDAPPFLLAPGLSGCGLLAVSLPAAPSSPPCFFPRRFIAIHSADRHLAHCSALFSRNPDLALLRFLRGSDDVRLPSPPFTPERLKRVARRLLRSAHG